MNIIFYKIILRAINLNFIYLFLYINFIFSITPDEIKSNPEYSHARYLSCKDLINSFPVFKALNFTYDSPNKGTIWIAVNKLRKYSGFKKLDLTAEEWDARTNSWVSLPILMACNLSKSNSLFSFNTLTISEKSSSSVEIVKVPIQELKFYFITKIPKDVITGETTNPTIQDSLTPEMIPVNLFPIHFKTCKEFSAHFKDFELVYYTYKDAKRHKDFEVWHQVYKFHHLNGKDHILSRQWEDSEKAWLLVALSSYCYVGINLLKKSDFTLAFLSNPLTIDSENEFIPDLNYKANLLDTNVSNITFYVSYKHNREDAHGLSHIRVKRRVEDTASDDDSLPLVH